jgi:membrane associated rhomboid family serine protease
VSSGGPDLFVICKSCGSEVSPYITECPYCGNRLRKRAPKLDRGGRPKERPQKQPRRAPKPSLGPLKRGEIPGIRVDSRPYATIAIVVASAVLFVLLSSNVLSAEHFVVVSDGTIGGPSEWWTVFTAAFSYVTTGYAFAVITATAVFGWLLERRHGALVVFGLYLIGAAGGLAVVMATGTPELAMGGNGGALALVAAWAVPDMLDLRKGREIDGDLLGAATVAVILLLLPVVVYSADALAGATGLLAGLLLGLPLARRRGG